MILVRTLTSTSTPYQADCKNDLPLQNVPFPVNPSLHWHLYDPFVLIQTDSLWHSLVPVSHSFMSEQLPLPSCVKPNIHAQLYDPWDSVHVEFIPVEHKIQLG